MISKLFDMYKDKMSWQNASKVTGINPLICQILWKELDKQ